MIKMNYIVYNYTEIVDLSHSQTKHLENSFFSYFSNYCFFSIFCRITISMYVLITQLQLKPKHDLKFQQKRINYRLTIFQQNICFKSGAYSLCFPGSKFSYE